MAIYSEFSHKQMVIFHSYVSLPEGNQWEYLGNMTPERTSRRSRRQVDIDKRIKRDSDRLSALYKVCTSSAGCCCKLLWFTHQSHGKFMGGYDF